MQNKLFVILLFFITQSLYGQPSLLKDINPGSAPAFAEGAVSSLVKIPMVKFQNKIYYVANDGTNGSELWESDGTPEGTQLLLDINPGSAGSDISEMTVIDNLIWFGANNGMNGVEVWTSDGTAAGTAMLKDGLSGSEWLNPRLFTKVGNLIYFKGNQPNGSGESLWKTDGTATGTELVTLIFAPTPEAFGNFTAFDGKLFFSGGDGELWASDGTSTGTIKVKDIYPGFQSALVNNMGVHFGKLYFAARSEADGREPWISDGTTAGTVQIKNISSGNGNSNASYFHSFKDKVYFSASNALWRTDGTDAGTEKVKDVYPAFLQYDPGKMVSTATHLYFPGDGPAGIELWRTDGTAAGTEQLNDLNSTFSGDSAPQELIIDSANNAVFFRAKTFFDDYELYRSDGTVAGTKLVSEINTSAASNPQSFIILGNDLYFVADDGINGRELWKLSLVSSASAPDEVTNLFSVSPNPASGNLNVLVTGEINSKQDYVCQIRDITGRIWYNNVFSGTTNNHLNIPLGNITPGIYTVALIYGNQRQTHKIAIIK